jgi:cell division protein FtsQ
VSPPPANTKRAAPPRAILDAPLDAVMEDSPVPSAATTTVRPPPNGKKRRLGRLARTLELVLGVTIVLGASVAVAWGARRYVMQSPRFAVRNVLVDGNKRRAATTVASEAGVEVGQNIFAIDLRRAGAMLTQDPWIERATVARKLPSTVTISVVEREAAGMCAIAGELYLVTRDGDLFKKIGAEDPSDLLVVTGISPAQVANDRPGVVIAVRRALDVADELERAGVTRRYPLEELHLDKDGSLVVTIGREGIALSLGQPPYRDKLEEAARILNEVARRKANAGVIFLDNDAHPERVVVRMR